MSALRELRRQAPLVGRQLRRSPRRTALTFLGLVIAFFLFTALESVLYTMGTVVRTTASDALLFVRKADRSGRWLNEVPARYVGEIERMPGVVAAAGIRFHFGAARREGSFAVAMGVDPDDYRKLGLPDGVSAMELEALRSGRDAALVGERLLEDQGWKIGDRATIRGAGDQVLAFTIAGDIARGDRLDRVALVHLDAMEKRLGGAGRLTYIRVLVRDAGIAPALADAIDARFANHAHPTETFSEKAHVAPFVASLADAMNGLRIVGLLALAVTLVVVANSVAIGVRERTREIGTLRALGYGRGRVVGLVLSEAIVVAVAGGLVGAAAAYLLFRSGSVAIPGAPFEFTTDASVLARSALLSIPLGALAGAQPAWSAVRMTITDALRFSD